MNRFNLLRTLKSTMLLFALLSFNIATAQIDLELSIGAENPNIEQWSSGGFTLTLRNKGTVAATGVSILMELSKREVTLVGSTLPVASSGVYNKPVWQNITVPANGTATLDLRLYSKVAALNLFAEVIAADQNDVDSSPANGQVDEDDEATFIHGQINEEEEEEIGDEAILTILNSSCPTQYPAPNGTLSFDVIIRNTSAVASAERNLGLFRMIEGRRGSFSSNLYSVALIPSIPAGSTKRLTISYSIPFEQILTPGTVVGYEMSVGTDVLSFLDAPTQEDRGYAIDLYCKKDNSDVAVAISTEEMTYGEDGKLKYSIQVSNNGNKAVHNSTLVYARTGMNAGLVDNVSYPENTSVYDEVNISAAASPKYWLIPVLGANETLTIEVDYIVATTTDNEGFRLDELTVSTLLTSPHLVDENTENNTSSMTFTGEVIFYDGIDLELSLSTDTPNVARWQKATYTLSLENKGTTTATGVVVSIPINGNEAIVVGGTRPSPSAGVYTNPFWDDLSVAVGESVTLEFQLFSKVDDLQLFAQVTAADQADVDSAPNNGSCCILQEDDEATLLSDLSLSNIQFPTQVERGEDTRFTLDVDNIGDATARGEFILGFYLSEDDVLEEGDRFVGIIRTADLTVGKHEANALINIARDVLPGNYYLLAVIDVDGEVQELNEENNHFSTPLAVGRDGDIDLALHFESTSTQVNKFVPLPMTLTISNTGEGDATGVIAYFPLEAGKVVLAGGTVPTFSQGNYNYFSGMWYVNDLAAGESATLEIMLYPNTDDYIPFAQVLDAQQNDVDSTPDNGRCCWALEDDEVVFPEGAGGDYVDIELELATPNTEVGRFNKLPLITTIRNNGTTAATDIFVSLQSCGLSDTRLFYRESGIVYANNNSAASLGTYSILEQLWRIPSLAAGETATLAINLYSITDEQIRVRAIAGGYTGTDIDSSPMIFDYEGCEVLEDDEAILDINTGSNVADLPLLTSPSTDLKAYPNPVSDWLTIAFQTTSTTTSYELYDAQGKRCMQGIWKESEGYQQKQLHVQDLPTGIYVLRIKDGIRQQTIRFSKLN